MDGAIPFGALKFPGADTVSPVVARVVDLAPEGPVLAVGARRIAGRRATSCIVEPLVDDTVLAVDTGSGMFVMAILERPSDTPAVLSVPDTASATLAQQQLALRCTDLAVDAERTTLRSKVAQVAGRTLNAVADRLDVVGRILRRSADYEFSHAKTATRTVEGAESVSAGEIMLEAKSALAQRAGIVMVDAREDVRINGERITMG